MLRLKQKVILKFPPAEFVSRRESQATPSSLSVNAQVQ